MLFTSLVFVDPDFGPTSQRFVSGLANEEALN